MLVDLTIGVCKDTLYLSKAQLWGLSTHPLFPTGPSKPKFHFDGGSECECVAGSNPRVPMCVCVSEFSLVMV